MLSLLMGHCRSGLLRWSLLAILTLWGAGCARHEGKDFPKFGTLESFQLTDQAGRSFTADSLRGEVWVAAFFFTRCPTICPRITRTMRQVQLQGEKIGGEFRLVSFSVDPSNDTPEVLRTYAKEHGADLGTWTFATGDNSEIRKTAVEGFKLALEGSADPDADHFGITHGSHLVLVDKQLTIRGFYRSSDPFIITELAADAKRLAER